MKIEINKKDAAMLREAIYAAMKRRADDLSGECYFDVGKANEPTLFRYLDELAELRDWLVQLYRQERHEGEKPKTDDSDDQGSTQKPAKRAGRPKKEIDWGKILALYKAGLTQKNITEEMGCHQKTVGKILNEELGEGASYGADDNIGS